ncbi:hypothetical protein COU37_01520 [Candidatus Micrarchaeota archaeon CG10_big_fil_rev_8_21_14_0_10_45_29]|nr:MAG: hypothetical protein COU37_01520 [Candidatus Micrarchaeota archaeon CG10_big_fil_rev_8_21_14_0_10_45_29]
MKNLQVVCVGHLVYDIRDYVKEFPQPDKTSFLMRPPAVSAGGSAANVAFNLIKMGHSAGLVSNVGNDAHGNFLLSELKKEKISHAHVKKIKNGRTGLSVILINRKGSVMVVEDVGCVDAPRKLPANYIGSSKWVHITGCDYSWMLQACKAAKKAGVPISLDPGRAASRLGEKKLSKLFYAAELLIINQTELEAIAGSRSFEKVKYLSKKYDMSVILKTGHGPAIACMKGEKIFDVPPFNAPYVVDTLGAGDAFASGVISGILEKRSVYEAIRMGHACAAAKVMNAGAQAMPKRKTIRKRFKF